MFEEFEKPSQDNRDEILNVQEDSSASNEFTKEKVEAFRKTEDAGFQDLLDRIGQEKKELCTAVINTFKDASRELENAFKIMGK